MKVFVVTNGTFSDYCIKAIFSTRELAEKYFDDLSKISNDKPQIQEWELDNFQQIEYDQFWHADINLLTGEITNCDTSYLQITEHTIPKRGEYVLNQPRQSIRGFVTIDLNQIVRSYVSEEHAKKLAVEARQEFLRTYDINKIKQRGVFWIYEDVTYPEVE